MIAMRTFTTNHTTLVTRKILRAKRICTKEVDLELALNNIRQNYIDRGAVALFQQKFSQIAILSIFHTLNPNLRFIFYDY